MDRAELPFVVNVLITQSDIGENIGVSAENTDVTYYTTTAVNDDKLPTQSAETSLHNVRATSTHIHQHRQHSTATSNFHRDNDPHICRGCFHFM